MGKTLHRVAISFFALCLLAEHSTIYAVSHLVTPAHRATDQSFRSLFHSEALAVRAISPWAARLFVNIQTFERLRHGLQSSHFQRPPYAIPAHDMGDSRIEYVDVRDLSGNPTGWKVPRKLAHRDGIPHGGVTIIPFNLATGDILLHERSDDKDTFKGCLDVLGGHPKAGMSDEEALYAESSEELFYIEPWRFIPVGPHNFKFIANVIHPMIGHNIEFKRVYLVGFWPDEIQQIGDRNTELGVYVNLPPDGKVRVIEDFAKGLFARAESERDWSNLSIDEQGTWKKEAAGYFEIKSYVWANWTPIDGAVARYRKNPEKFADGFFSLLGDRRYRNMIASTIWKECLRQQLIDKMKGQHLGPSQRYFMVLRSLVTTFEFASAVRLLRLWPWRQTSDFTAVQRAVQNVAAVSISEKRLLSLAFPSGSDPNRPLRLA